MSSILENTAFVVQSVIKTEKLELSLTLTCSMQEEKQTARIVIPRDQKMKDHPAYEFGLKLLTGKISANQEVIVSGVLVVKMHFVRTLGGEIRGLSSRLEVTKFAVAPRSNLVHYPEFDAMAATFYGDSTNSCQKLAKRITRSAVTDVVREQQWPMS